MRVGRRIVPLEFLDRVLDWDRGGFLRWRVEEVVLRPDRDVLIMQVGEADVQGRGTPASSYCVKLVLSLCRGGVRGPGLRLVGDALILEEDLVLDFVILG